MMMNCPECGKPVTLADNFEFESEPVTIPLDKKPVAIKWQPPVHSACAKSR